MAVTPCMWPRRLCTTHHRLRRARSITRRLLRCTTHRLPAITTGNIVTTATITAAIGVTETMTAGIADPHPAVAAAGQAA